MTIFKNYWRLLALCTVLGIVCSALVSFGSASSETAPTAEDELFGIEPKAVSNIFTERNEGRYLHSIAISTKRAADALESMAACDAEQQPDSLPEGRQ